MKLLIFSIGGRFEMDPTWRRSIRAPEQNREDLFGTFRVMTRQSSHDSSSRAREFCQLGTDILCLFVLRRQAGRPFQNSQSRDSRNRPSAKNEPRVRDFDSLFWRETTEKGFKKKPGETLPHPGQTHPRTAATRPKSRHRRHRVCNPTSSPRRQCLTRSPRRPRARRRPPRCAP